MSSRGCNNSMQSSGGGSSPIPSHSSSHREGDPENTASDTQPRHNGVGGLLQLPPVDETVISCPQQAATPLKVPRIMDPSGKIPDTVIPQYCKTLTATDTMYAGRFIVPKDWVGTLFPRLDYDYLEKPELQIVFKDDIKGISWRLDYICRKGSTTHILQNGWHRFVVSYSLKAGDEIEFSKTSSGELCVKIKKSQGKSIIGSSGRSTHENYGPAVGLIAPTAASSRTKSFTGISGKSSQEDHGQASGVVVPIEPSSNSAPTAIPPSCKTLSRTDAISFLVPKRWTDGTLFPRLDYRLENPKLQILLEDDIKGKSWRLDYMYRTSKNTHHLQNGWKRLVDSYSLKAGDEIEFSKASSGELCVKIKKSQGKSIMGSSRRSTHENYGPAVGLIAPAAASSRMKSIAGSSEKSSQEDHGQASGVVVPIEPSSNSAPTTLLLFGNDVRCLDSNIDSKGKSHQQHDLQGSRLDGDRIRENAGSFSQSTHLNGKSHHQHDSRGDRLDEDEVRENSDPSSQSSHSIVSKKSETVQHTVDLSQFPSDGDGDVDGRTAMMFGQEFETVEDAVDLSQFSSYDELCERVAMMFGLEVISMDTMVYKDTKNISRTVGSEPYADFAASLKRIEILSSSKASRKNGGFSSDLLDDASLE